MKLPQLSWNQVILSLLIGFVLGSAVSPLRGGRECFPHHKGKGGMKQHMLDRFTKELKLTEDQKVKVSAIFESKHAQMEALRSEIQPKFEALRTATQNEIRPLLTPEQQVKFDQLNEKMEKRWKRHKKDFDR